MPKGRVINLNGGNYIVLTDDNEKIVCRARGKLRSVVVDKKSSFNTSKNKLSTKLDVNTIKLSPKVGDFVDIEINDGVNYIINVYERKNQLVRPDISNVDQIILIFAAKRPDFSFLLLDMFLVNLEKQNITPLIVISKIDLLTESELKDLKNKLKYYEKIGYNVVYVNSMDLTNKSEITEYLSNKISVLSGQTGAGKSTLINALIPGFSLNTQDISEALGRGKHTTRETTLYQHFNGLLGDTPGFSKLDLQDIKPEELKNYFIEFSDKKCRFKDCNHESNSLGCEIVNDNEILKSRYENYIKIYNDLKESNKR